MEDGLLPHLVAYHKDMAAQAILSHEVYDNEKTRLFSNISCLLIHEEFSDEMLLFYRSS
jgi:hypothetical protein